MGRKTIQMRSVEDRSGYRNLGRTIQDRLTFPPWPLLAKPLDLLNRYRGMVYQDANRQCEAAERHGIDRLS